MSKPAARFSTRSQPAAIASEMASSRILLRATSYQPLRVLLGTRDNSAAMFAGETFRERVTE